MGQQLPVGLYRSAAREMDVIWSRVIAGGVLLCVMLDERGSKGWRVMSILTHDKHRTSAHQHAPLLTAELIEPSNSDTEATLNTLVSNY